MIDSDRPLDAGVDLKVRLPGKNLQRRYVCFQVERKFNINCAIFALLNPSQLHLLLDEVDAALDEANVSRYNDLLNVLSDSFQFIVITHRRGTMEVLDTLYGVTMQEPEFRK